MFSIWSDAVIFVSFGWRRRFSSRRNREQLPIQLVHQVTFPFNFIPFCYFRGLYYCVYATGYLVFIYVHNDNCISIILRFIHELCIQWIYFPPKAIWALFFCMLIKLVGLLGRQSFFVFFCHSHALLEVRTTLFRIII